MYRMSNLLSLVCAFDYRLFHLPPARLKSCLLLLLLFCLLWPLYTSANEAPLISKVQQGGYILYFRHAQTEWSQADRYNEEMSPQVWSSCDPDVMRQLSEEGRATAREIGDHIRRLEIPVSAVYASEYCRTAETARQMNLGPVQTTRDILNARAARFIGGSEALKKTIIARFSAIPPDNTNTVLVAHGNVIVLVGGARPVEAGAAVIKPLGNNDYEIVGYLTPDDWERY